MNHSLLRSAGLAAVSLTLAFGLSACGGSDESPEPQPAKTTAAMDDGPASQTFGPACGAIPKSGAGSFNGMATAPVASAASANPLLKTLVSAVTEADLVDTLNSAKSLTVFAPTDDAFAKLPKADLDKVMADKALLTKILTHHVVGEELDPAAVSGEHETLNKDSVMVEGDESGMTVDGAKVLCGNIPTANATVYVIDTVLMP
jgi:uncharacterized surface protein with fasciclin (FAS1) repeats